ncbi:MAG: hypothetical protein ABI480_15085 [Chitinophagaceae bacterium]
MTSQFETFLNFNDIESANIVTEKLKENGIEHIIDRSKPLLDTSIVGSSFDQNFHVKLRRMDFQKGHKALEEYYKTQVDNVSNDYYLMSFSDDELKDIIAKPDEWGHFNYQLAQKLLKDKGIEVSERTLNELKEKRINKLAQPEKASRFLLILGYGFIPFGAIIGFLIGRHLFYSKKTLPDGKVVFSYFESDRRHGHRIMIICGVFILLAIVFLFVLFARDI